jgi:glycosyltransferase involved in cell wall biosynthesis
MKVLHVIRGLNRAAGTSVFCAELCKHLKDLGVDCAIAVQNRNGEAYPLDAAIPCIEATSTMPNGLPFSPDLIHVHALWSPFLHRYVSWARDRGIPYVISPHGMLTSWALGQKRLKKQLALFLYQRSDLRGASLLHATAESEVEDIRRIGLQNPVCVVPLGISLPTQSIRRTLSPVKVLLFISRIQRKKGLLNLVKAWHKLMMERGTAQVGPHPLGWRIQVAGPDQDSHEQEVRTLAEKLGVAEDFEFIGPVFGIKKNNLYAQAELFVLPTHSENFGVVVIEALAHGVPVITTKGAPWSDLLGSSGRAIGIQAGENHTEVPCDQLMITDHGSRIITNDRCGWWIDIGVEPLAKALHEAMSLSDAERHRMGVNGRCLVQKKYAWPTIAASMKVEYSRMLAR